MWWSGCCFFFFQAEDGIRDAQESRGLGDVYKRQKYVGSDNRTIRQFKDYLEKRGIFTTQRFEFGKDIEGACGQLIVKN